MLPEKEAYELGRSRDWFRYFLPYCLQSIKLPPEAMLNRKHVYLPLNRNYKPLGVLSREIIRYEDYWESAVVFRQDPHTFKNIWIKPNRLFLYDDGSDTRLDYFERLGRLCGKMRTIQHERMYY